MRKKLFIVRPTMGYGGADKITLTLLQHLDQKEFELHLILMKAEGEFIKDIPTYVNVIDCKSKNLWFFILPLYKILKKENPDIVFSTSGGTNMPLSLCSLIHKGRAYRSILSERSIITKTTMIWVKRILYPFADEYTAVSEGVKSNMAELLKIQHDKIRVVNNPIITSDLLNKSKEECNHLWFSEKRKIPVMLHVGRFVPQKDHDTLIKAFHELRKEIKVRLFLLGEGPLKQDIKNLVKKLDLSEDVIFAGFDKNPFKYMTNCDLFVLSSKQEGMPGVLIQAMACGAACISTDCKSGPNEIIKTDENGILVPVGNTHDMTIAMKSLLIKPDLRRKIGERGKLSVSKFNVDTALKSYKTVILNEQ